MNLTGARNARIRRQNDPDGADSIGDDARMTPRKIPGEKEIEPTASNIAALMGGNFGALFG
jgi:hypothetical protein